MALLDKIKNLLPGASQSPAAQAGKSVNKRVVLFGVLLVVSIIIMAVLFSLATLLSRPNDSYVTVMSEQQVLSQQIAVNAAEAAKGDANAFKRLASNQDRYQDILRLLDTGDSINGIPALPDNFESEYSNLKSLWNGFDKNINDILGDKSTVDNVRQQATLISESMPELIRLSESIISEQSKSGAPANNLAIAGKQLALLRGVENNLNLIISGGSNILAASDQLAVDLQIIDKQLTAMSKGDESQGVTRFIGGKVVGELRKFTNLYRDTRTSINEVLNFSAKLSKVHEATAKIQTTSPRLLSAATELSKRVVQEDARLQILSLTGYGFGIVALVLLIMMVMLVVNESRARLAESQDQNEKNQRAILRLLDEMTNLADGDLSTHTTVTEDITGAIADSVNYSIDALRDLVATINKTSVQVNSAVQKTQGTTGQLAEASNAQTQEITGASQTITQISRSMSDVSVKAADSAEVARKSVSIAHKGGETVRQTIAGMETIREQIQETSKRIKRLGESSQEIGDIVNLITEISDQTNILALNAAIQASMAGEAGRGFAVVADEVQRLAERTGDATKQIEALVKTIQADTNEATVSMEQSTANVVKGAKLTENAGGALDRIEQVSMNLAQRILEISDATKSQADESVKITQTMDSIQDITQKTADGSNQASQSIGELMQMVNAMQNSVAGFKLPGLGDSGNTVATDSEDLSSHDLMGS